MVAIYCCFLATVVVKLLASFETSLMVMDLLPEIGEAFLTRIGQGCNKGWLIRSLAKTMV